MYKIILLALILLSLTGCDDKKNKTRDWTQILESGELTVITLNTSTTYFIYKDEPMGYDYDLVKDFCDDYGLKLNVKVAENSAKLVEMLLNGEGDMIAAPVTITNSLKDSLIYCGLEMESHQVLVQRNSPKDSLLKDVTQLIGKDVYVNTHTQYASRIKNLNSELGGGINIKDIAKDTITVEDLIEMVAFSEIDYTVADDYIAQLNRTYYHDIDISLPLSFKQRSAWAVRLNDSKLAEVLNKWFKENNRSPDYNAIIKKYFELSKIQSDAALLDDIGEDLPEGSISSFDYIFWLKPGHQQYDRFPHYKMLEQTLSFVQDL